MPVYMYHFTPVGLVVGSAASNWCLMNFYINTTNSRSFEKYKIIDYIVDAFLLQEMHTGHFVWSWGGRVQVREMDEKNNYNRIFLRMIDYYLTDQSDHRNIEKDHDENKFSAQTLTVRTLEFTTSVRLTVLTGELLGKSNVFVEI